MAADNYIDVGSHRKSILIFYRIFCEALLCHRSRLQHLVKNVTLWNSVSYEDKTSISTYEFSIRVCAAFGDDGTPLVGFLLEKLLEPSRLQQFLGSRLSAELVKPPHNIRIRERGFHR